MTLPLERRAALLAAVRFRDHEPPPSRSKVTVPRRDPTTLTPREIVARYVESGYRIVLWPEIGDEKGPREVDWQHKPKTLADYHDGDRVGIMTGTEIAPGRYAVDVDIDWAPGSLIAQAMLLATPFVFGRARKKVSHCVYTADEPIASIRYEDIDKTCLIELRGTTRDGTIGMQSMCPPSIWSKDGQREPLQFAQPLNGHLPTPSHYAAETIKRAVLLSAIGMLLAKHLGHNGFGHEARLCWAGFLLRAGIAIDDLEKMGQALSRVCNNIEVHDVRRTLESTATALADGKKKVKGGSTLAKLLGANGRQIVARINEWLGRDSDFVRDKSGHIVPKNQHNIRRAIEVLGLDLSYNQFADKLLIDDQPMEDGAVDALFLQIESEFHFSPPDQYFEKVIKNIARRNSFHPVKDYLDKLTWDGTARIDTWLIDAAGVKDSVYTRAVSSIMLIAAVKRVRQPGCKYDEMVVWESPQGAYKSTAAQALCPDPTWFSDDFPLNVRSQQLIEATVGKWIIEASDLAGRRKTEIEQLKAMLSRQVDGPARMAYAHFPVERPRHFILIGTTNSSVYLPDSTGARRFWPLATKRFDVAWIKKCRDQLWAEACVREATGESIRLREDLWPAATEEQEQRREIDPWEGLLRSALSNVAPSSAGLRRVATTLLWDVLDIPVERRDRSGSLRISDVMQRLGYKRTRVTHDGEKVVGFVEIGEETLIAAEREPGEEG
jgi:predicted P-loop ATPase